MIRWHYYHLALRTEEPMRILFLAVPVDVYDQFFVLPFIQESLTYNEVNYLVYDVDTKVIVQWKK